MYTKAEDHLNSNAFFAQRQIFEFVKWPYIDKLRHGPKYSLFNHVDTKVNSISEIKGTRLSKPHAVPRYPIHIVVRI